MILPYQVGKNAGINGAGTRAHHEAVERRESHGGVDAEATAYRGQRAAIAEVARHELQLGEICLQQLRGSTRAVLMVDAMKAKFADALLDPLIRTGINVRRFRQRIVEASVKHSHLQNPAAELFDLCDAIQFGAI